MNWHLRMNEVIRLENVSIGFEKTPILDGINLSISRDEFWGVVGPNGGGKTTLLKTLIGLKDVIKGKYEIKGGIRLGYVPQQEKFDRIFPVSVVDIVTMGRYSRIPFGSRVRKQDREIVNESIDKVGMLHMKNVCFRSISGGEKQRALIARAMAGEPDVLVLDEPTASVDTMGQTEIMLLIKKISEENSFTVVMASHYIDLMKNFAEKFVFIDKDRNLFRIYDENGISSDKLFEGVEKN